MKVPWSLASSIRGPSLRGLLAAGTKGPSARRTSTTMAAKREPRVVADFVNSEILNHSILEFGRSTCPFSRAARAALITVLPDEFVTTHWIDTMPQTVAIKEYLTEMTGKQTVPYVFVAGEFIGGGDETVALVESNRLIPLLVAADVPVPPRLDKPAEPAS